MKTSYYVDLEVPCRMCAACLAARRNLWAYRAKVEHAEAARTWFGTFTLRPEEHFKAVASLMLRAASSGRSHLTSSSPPVTSFIRVKSRFF